MAVWHRLPAGSSWSEVALAGVFVTAARHASGQSMAGSARRGRDHAKPEHRHPGGGSADAATIRNTGPV